MFSLLSKYFTVFFLSMLKFIGGPLSGAAFGFAWTFTAILTIAGMMASVAIFSLLGKPAKVWLQARFRKNKRLFTPRNRRSVKIWRKYGLKGVAFLTPILFTPIGGTLVASSFGESKGRIFLYMLCSAVFWGIILSYLITQFGKALPIH